MRKLRFALPLAFGLLGLVALGCSSEDSPTDGGGGGGSLEMNSPNLSNGQSYLHVFSAAKVVPYYCKFHGASGGSGMAGVITVTAGGTPSLHEVEINSSTFPDLTVDVGDTVRWTNNTGLAHTVTSDS